MSQDGSDASLVERRSLPESGYWCRCPSRTKVCTLCAALLFTFAFSWTYNETLPLPLQNQVLHQEIPVKVAKAPKAANREARQLHHSVPKENKKTGGARVPETKPQEGASTRENKMTGGARVPETKPQEGASERREHRHSQKSLSDDAIQGAAEGNGDAIVSPKSIPTEFMKVVRLPPRKAITSTAEPTEYAENLRHERKTEIMTKDSCETLLRRIPRPSKQHCKIGPYLVEGKWEEADESSPRRVAYVIRGESFRRNNGMHDREILVNSRTRKCQIDASASQVKFFIEPLEACGVKVDVFIITWKPEGKNHAEIADAMKEMKATFGRRVVWSEWRDHMYTYSIKVNGQLDNYNFSLQAVAEHYKRTDTRYDALFIVRSDLVIKRTVWNAPDAKWSKILVLYHEWEQGGGYPANLMQQRVPETIFWYPWKFANCAVKLGWKEHDFAFMHELVGFPNLGYMWPQEYHDANSAADWNPIYTQACRVFQRYDIHGGHAHAFFNVQEIIKPSHAPWTGQRFIETMYMQGHPRTIPPSTIVMHTWSQKAVADQLHTTYGQVPQEEHHDPLSTFPQRDEAVADKSGWFLALSSMERSFKLLRTNKELKYKSAFHKSYRYDIVSFLRVEHFFKTRHFEIYDYNTTNATFVGYGAKMYPDVPTAIFTSHQGAWKLGMWLVKGKGHSSDTWNSKKLPPKEQGAEAWLREVIGKPVQLLCQNC